MQKNDKSYTFLLSHSSQSRIHIKRYSVPKSLVHVGSVTSFLVICISILGLGASRIFETREFAEVIAKTSVISRVAAQSAGEFQIVSDNASSLETSAGGDYAQNTGGPTENDQAIATDEEADSEILAFKQNADPDHLPTVWAHLGKINNEFGFRRNPFGGRAYEFHPGMDIDGERGDPVIAPANGTVISAGYKGGYGNMVEIDHGNGLVTRYGHMSKIETEVGATINRGTVIGQVGSTGRSTGPHLHFEVRLNDRPINPRFFLPPEPADLKAIER